MATTLNTTPVLEGTASKQFNQTLLANRSIKISLERKQKMAQMVAKILSNKK